MSDFGDDFRHFMYDAFGLPYDDAIHQKQLEERQRQEEDKWRASDPAYQEFSERYVDDTIKEQDQCEE